MYTYIYIYIHIYIYIRREREGDREREREIERESIYRTSIKYLWSVCDSGTGSKCFINSCNFIASLRSWRQMSQEGSSLSHLRPRMVSEMRPQGKFECGEARKAS